MRKNKYEIAQVLDPDEITDMSEAQKQHYLSLGYQPCRLTSGKIKWLNPSQQVSAFVTKKPEYRFIPVKKSRAGSSKRRRRRYSSPSKAFIREHWFFIVLIALIMIGLLFVVKYWNLIV